ncbi:MAG: hypothetical protein FJZ95_11680, partial [Chloroflexi bacterium]|nr:hypothetical protein [Chloroflexota bacterium]
SRPARERVYAGAQATDDGGTNLKKESLFYYDGNNTSQTTPPTVGNLTRVESKIDASNSVSGYYTYDSYGNVLTETDPRNKVWTTNYESTYHVFPAKIIAPDNSGSETYSFDVKTGNLLSRTDVNGQSTSYEYDTFGRLTGIKRPGPDGQPETIPSTQYQYNNWGTLNQQHLKSLGKVAEGDYLWSSQYFDGLGRVIQTQSRGETGRTIINSTTVYNNRGLVDKGYISQDYDSTQINGYTVLEPGLVAHWSMDEGSGTVARDNMGGNNVMISGATWTNGKENLALSFDGQDDYAQTTPNPSITGPITIQAWIRPNTSGKEMRFIHGGSQYLLSVRSDNKVSFSDALGHGVTTDAGVLTLNDWNHVIAVFTGTAGTGVTLENCNIYVNGVSRGTQATGTWSPGSAGTLKLGGNAEADEVEVLSDPGGWYGEGATRSRDWTISESKVITRIWTYHDNSVEGAPPNYIYIRKSSDGSIVWQGMSTGGEYHHWVYPGVTLPAGTYYCTDAAANWQKNQWGMGQT